jgi:hypothetical protein
MVSEGGKALPTAHLGTEPVPDAIPAGLGFLRPNGLAMFAYPPTSPCVEQEQARAMPPVVAHLAPSGGRAFFFRHKAIS